jgi:hypothetical protein
LSEVIGSNSIGLALSGKFGGTADAIAGGATSVEFSNGGAACTSIIFGGLTITGARVDGGIGAGAASQEVLPCEVVLKESRAEDEAAICCELAEDRCKDSASCLALHPPQQTTPTASTKKIICEKHRSYMESSQIHIFPIQKRSGDFRKNRELMPDQLF